MVAALTARKKEPSFSVMSNIKFKELYELQHCEMLANILWKPLFHFKQPVPNWQDMMHIFIQGHTHPNQSSIQYFSMIDMYPRDKTCILSSLEFLSNLAITHYVPLVITFDQAMY